MIEILKAPWLRLSTAAAVAVLLGACNKTPTAATPAATPAKPDASAPVAVVNGTNISRASFDIYVKTLTEGKNIPELTSDQKGQVLDQLVSMQLLANQSKKDGLDSSDEVVSRLNLSNMRILSDAEILKYLKEHEPSDAEIKTQYDTVVASGEATEYHARHILVDSSDKAVALIKKLKAGAKFEDVAKAESSDPSKNNGGDLGWFSLGNMVPEFAQAVKKLKKGELTADPVKTQYGWHIIKLEDTRDPSLEQLKPRLSQTLAQKKLFAYVEEMKKTAQIDKKL
jgi:peptidyl-prolyl cis-trans isomerase C